MSWTEHFGKRIVDLERKVWDLQDENKKLNQLIQNLCVQLSEKENELHKNQTNGGAH